MEIMENFFEKLEKKMVNVHLWKTDIGFVISVLVLVEINIYISEKVLYCENRYFIYPSGGGVIE